MTYQSGGLIQAADFNGFAGPTASGGNANANLNDVWSTGSGDKGWGQTAVPTVAAGATVAAGVTGPIASATSWAGLVTDLSLAGQQTNTTLTSRTAPTAGQTISILSAVNTDLTNVTTNRGNAAASGSQYTTSGSSAGPAESNNAAGWTMTFTQTMTFANANSARYFFNAGGIVRVAYSKSSTGTDKDPDWNQLAGWCGTINFTGRVAGAAQTIAGQAYTGTTRLGGSGGTQTTLATTTGFYSLTPGAAATPLFQLNDSAPYGSDYIKTTVALNSGSTVLTFVTTWVDAGYSGAGKSNNITAGATTALSYFPPSSLYLTPSWNSPSAPTLSSSVA